MFDTIRKLRGDARGATVIEYGLIIGLVVIAMMVGLGSFANVTINLWNTVSNRVTSA